RIACAPGHNRFGLPAKRHEDREAAVSFLLQRSDVGEFRRRYRWLVLVVLVAFMVVIGRLVQLQLIEGDVHRAQARRNIVRERYLATTRGVLRDANGRVLAANRPSYTVRSEEHTSELQSRENLVCRLLLEKKNTSMLLPQLTP